MALNELGFLPDGTPVTAAEFNGLVAIINALTALIDGLDVRLDVLGQFLGVDIDDLADVDIVDLPDLSTYQPEETR
jgi:hypothetical protein